jgi:hypothetical protein
MQSTAKGYFHTPDCYTHLWTAVPRHSLGWIQHTLSPLPSFWIPNWTESWIARTFNALWYRHSCTECFLLNFCSVVFFYSVLHSRWFCDILHWRSLWNEFWCCVWFAGNENILCTNAFCVSYKRKWKIFERIKMKMPRFEGNRKLQANDKRSDFQDLKTLNKESNRWWCVLHFRHNCDVTTVRFSKPCLSRDEEVKIIKLWLLFIPSVSVTGYFTTNLIFLSSLI